MTKLYLHCPDCGNIDKSPMTTMLISMLNKGDKTNCTKCGSHNAVVTDGTEEVETPVQEELALPEQPEEVEESKFVKAPKGRKIIIRSTMQAEVEFSERDFPKPEDFESFKNDLYNNPGYLAFMCERNFIPENLEWSALLETATLEIVEDD